MARLTGKRAAAVLALGAAAAAAALLASPRSDAIRFVPCEGSAIPHVAVVPVMPRTFNNHSVQIGADCVSWQMFIALNWPAAAGAPGRPATAPAAAFGVPGDLRPGVWQSWAEASAVFADPARAVRSPSRRIELRVTQQTGGGWLTSQWGAPVYYEVRLNPDMVQWIAENNLATYAGQAACVRGKGGFNQPHGGAAQGASGNIDAGPDRDCRGTVRTFGRNEGAVSIKAAWVELPADGSLDYRYKTSLATLVDPVTGKAHDATVGLVGFHIARKLPGAEQLLWATFEQVDNAPDEGSSARPALPANAPARLAERPGFTFFDPACVPARDEYGCAHNLRPALPCTNLRPRSPDGCRPLSAPTQVTRRTPVDREIDASTADAWAAIRRALPAGTPDSVFAYYRLIDVQWPAMDIAPIAARTRVPLLTTNMIPEDGTRIVANTTMETYVQGQQSCMDCHSEAAIADAPDTGPARSLSAAAIRARVGGGAGAAAAAAEKGGFASDFSFVFANETTR